VRDGVIRLIQTLPLLAIFLLGACTKDREKWIGTWEGERKGLVYQGMDDATARDLKRIVIKILPNARYEMTEQTISSTGEVKFEGNRLVLKPMAQLDRAYVHADLTLELQPDGSVLYDDPEGNHPQPAELRKVGETSPPPSP
jgi:hypothetical protein